jgi:hypothetical protein
MNFDEIKYIFLILMNQLNIEEFKKFICWLDQLVNDYKECGNNFLGKLVLKLNLKDPKIN